MKSGCRPPNTPQHALGQHALGGASFHLLLQISHGGDACRVMFSPFACPLSGAKRTYGTLLEMRCTSRFLIASKQAASVTHLKAKSLRLVCERMRSPGHVARLLFGLRG